MALMKSCLFTVILYCISGGDLDFDETLHLERKRLELQQELENLSKKDDRESKRDSVLINKEVNLIQQTQKFLVEWNFTL